MSVSANRKPHHLDPGGEARELLEIRELLKQWSWWVRGFRVPIAALRCVSAERYYTKVTALSPRQQPMPDHLATEIETAIMRLEEQYRLCLRLAYCERFALAKKCRILGVGRSDFFAIKRTGEWMVAESVGLIAKKALKCGD